MKRTTIALVGNPNTGKTSLLNSLTGLSLHVGNWPGKTVQKKEADVVLGKRQIHLIDLPGIYTLHALSDEEVVSKEYLDQNQVDVVVQVIDINSLPRHLLMTYELLASGKKVVIASNFNREAKNSGVRFDLEGLSRVLEIPIVEVEAHRGRGKQELMRVAYETAAKDFHRPSYLDDLLQSDAKSIRHARALDFFQDKLRPHYHVESVKHQLYKLDRVLLNRYTALPIFLFIMTGMFLVTFQISRPLMAWVGDFFGSLGSLSAQLPLPDILNSFIENVIFGGLGAVLAFVPLLFLLFIMISLLEDSGYLGRTIVLVDRLFAYFGITGRSFIPMILGFGCNVPAVLATRTIKNDRERLIAVYTNSFIACGARLPVFVVMASIFFPRFAGIIIVGMYGLSILVNLTASAILSKFLGNTRPLTLIIELPPYRLPLLQNMLKHAWFHTREFLQKAATTILAVIVVAWFLASMPLGIEYGSAHSWLGEIGRVVSVILTPLGFGYWNFTVSLLFGIIAKEVVVGTLATLAHVPVGDLGNVLSQQLTAAGAMSFLIFVLFYAPCVATIAVMKKELANLRRWALVQPFIVTAVAWILAFAVYQLARQVL